MNFRTCKYFLTVCEMGTINAAARKLYISQQSLSQHIRKLEEEVGLQLFHRDHPLVLTEAGECVYRAAQAILSTLQQMDAELAVCRGNRVPELNIGMLDYGSPDFMASLLDLFLKKEPNTLVKTREIEPGAPLPPDVPLFIAARELGRGFKNEVLLYDRLVVCVRDSLLKNVFGRDWKERRDRLRLGDLTALEGCPFLRHSNTPLQNLSNMAFEANRFTPSYLPVAGTTNMMMRLCVEGRGALITLKEHSSHEPQCPPVYLISGVPEKIPTVYLCSRTDAVLSNAAQRFQEVTKAYFKRRSRENANCGA